MTCPARRRRDRRGRRPGPGPRRGFNLVEMLVAMAISAALLAAVAVALDASFRAYQATTELASTHTISRLTMDRMMAMIRSGEDFAPMPSDPTQQVVWSTTIGFRTPPRDLDDPTDLGLDMEIVFSEDDETLVLNVTNPGTGAETSAVLLEGVVPTYDDDGNLVPPFRLEYEKGRILHRATIDLTVVPDDNQSLQLEGDDQPIIRLVGSAMPRQSAY